MSESIYPIFASSGLVLELAREFYQEGMTKKYFDRIDLKSSQVLIDKILHIWKDYNVLLLYRKHFIFESICLYMQRFQSCQVVIFGAGMCPLSLRLLENFHDKIGHIFEIEQVNLDKKMELYSTVLKSEQFPITPIQCNLSEKGWMESIQKHKYYDHTIPTIILVEGLTYYISEEDLKKIIQFYHPSVFFIMDYLKKDFSQNLRYKEIAINTFDMIQEECKLPFIMKYSFTDIQNLFTTHRPTSKIEKYTLSDYEMKQSHKNILFPNREDGWIEFVRTHV